MQKNKLGNTEFYASKLCFGTLTFSPVQKNLSDKDSAKLLLAAFERGVNILDTAELYDNYNAIRLALDDWKEDTIVVSKCYAFDADSAEKSLEKALRALNRERIEIFMLHEQESEHTLRGHTEALEYFEKQKRAGKIAALGISTHFISGVNAAAKHPLIEIVHPIFNKNGLGVVDGSQLEMEAAVEACHEAGRGIIAMKPFGGGHLIKDRDNSLKYALSKPYLDSLAIGMQSIAEVEYNCAALSGKDPRPFSDAIDSQERKLLIEYWCKACGACVKRCQQGAISIENKSAVVDPSRCVLCGYCAAVCPEFCIKVV